MDKLDHNTHFTLLDNSTKFYNQLRFIYGFINCAMFRYGPI